jgi:L-alanine-DL-glutamate epimerase-like enolase superfamily enzyme
MEDVIPWWYTDMLKEITAASPTPTLSEDIYEIADFEKLCSNHAVDKIHPDLSTSGGILRTHKIGDMAYKYGVPMAMHFAGTPVACMANVHCAAATRNFLALENHSLDVPWWQDLVNEVDKPIIDRGYIAVPDTPGLGVTLTILHDFHVSARQCKLIDFTRLYLPRSPQRSLHRFPCCGGIILGLG